MRSSILLLTDSLSMDYLGKLKTCPDTSEQAALYYASFRGSGPSSYVIDYVAKGDVSSREIKNNGGLPESNAST